MERVHSLTEGSLGRLRHVGVALTRSGPSQRHIGLLHRETGSVSVRLLHLAWHCLLRNEVPDNHYVWVDPPINQHRARQVAAFCRKVWRQNRRRIPYAFSAPNDCFDVGTGRFLLGGSTLGLTCATFVIAVFQATGLPLVELESWPERLDDVEWQERMVALLKEHGADPRHVEHVEQEIGCARYRPEDVGGAAAHFPWPVSFEDAARNAEQILPLLDTGE